MFLVFSLIQCFQSSLFSCRGARACQTRYVMQTTKDLYLDLARLSGSTGLHQVDGSFHEDYPSFKHDEDLKCNDMDRTIWISREEEPNDHWAIYFYDDDNELLVILWKNLFSSNLSLPPKTG